MVIQGNLFARGSSASPPRLSGSDPDGLRFYQREAYNAVLQGFKEHASLLVVMATGLGKTQLMGALAKHWNGRVLMLAHRDELLTQAQHRFAQMTGEEVGREQATQRAGAERLVVASFDTARQKKRLERLLQMKFDLVLVDECHRGPATTRKKVIKALTKGGAKLLGVTATPDRGDSKALGQLFDEVAYDADILKGIEWGYLVPVEGDQHHVEEIDLSEVKKTAGDLQAGQLDEEVRKGAESIAQIVFKEYPNDRGILFFPGKASANLACERLNALMGPETAIVITDDTNKDVRKQLLRELKDGKYRWFCNCMIATEGFDWPQANVVGIARPTCSRALYAQMAGRGTRVLPGLVEHAEGKDNAAKRRGLIEWSAKPNMILADFTGNAGKHDLSTPEDLLGGDYTDEEIAQAKKEKEKSGESNPLKNLQEARRALKELAKSTLGKVKSHKTKFDPFQLAGTDSYSVTIFEQKYGWAPMTTKQKAALINAGYQEEELKDVGKRGANKLFDTMSKRRDKGLCSLKQQRLLRRWGLDTTNIKFEHASRAIDYLSQRGWGARPVDPATLIRIAEGR